MLLANQIAGFFKMYYLKKGVNDDVYYWYLQINVGVFYKFRPLFLVCVAMYAQSTQNKKFAYLCNISRKACGMKLIFCLQIKTKVFYRVIVSLWV